MTSRLLTTETMKRGSKPAASWCVLSQQSYRGLDLHTPVSASVFVVATIRFENPEAGS